MLEKKLATAIKILAYLSLIMPLIVMGNSFIFPFVFPKAIYFRVLVEIMLGLYIILCAVNKEYRPKSSPVLLAVGYLFFVLFLSSIFGVDFERSMWGNHERMSGWFTLVHFGVYFLILTNVFRSWVEWKWFLRASLGVSLIVGFTGLNFLLDEKSIMKIGGGGTMGNFIYLANFLLFHVFIAWFLFRKETIGGWKYFILGVSLVEILIMMYNGKRGPFVGLLAGLFVGLLLYGLFSKVKKWRILGVSLIAAATIFSAVIFVNRDSPWVQKIPMIGRLATISFSSGTGATRAIAWEIAYKAWKEKPVFGWGVENFYYAFNKFYNPKSLEHSYYETWFDRSHNIFLDYLSTGGILGFIGYLSVFGAVFYVLSVGFKRKKIDLDQLVFLAIFFVGYGLQNFFVFDHLSSYLTFYILLAFTDRSASLQLVSPAAPRSPDKNKNINPSTILVAVVILAVGFLVFKTNILPALANGRSFNAQMAVGTNFIQGIEKYKEAVATYTPHMVDLRSDFSRVILSFSQNQEALKSDAFKAGAQLMINELNKTINEHPLELNAYIILGQYYALFGDFENADLILQKAQDLSPQRQQVAYLRTKIKYMRREFKSAIDIINKTIQDNPNVADSYWYLAVIYSDLGDNEKAFENLKMGIARGKTLTQVGEMMMAGDLFKKFKDYEASIKYYNMAVSSVPNSPQLLLTLSELYSLTGDKEKAREMADRASLYDPAALEKARAWLK